jgi:hypothetical protein
MCSYNVHLSHLTPIRVWLVQASFIDYGLALPTSAGPHPAGTLAFMAIGRQLGHGFKVSHELEAIMYCLIYWACDGSLPWRHALGGHQALHWKWTSTTLQFEVGWLELSVHASESTRWQSDCLRQVRIPLRLTRHVL